MSDRITLRGITGRGRHGWYAQERVDGQVFRVDVVLELDTRGAAEHDDLARTADYGQIARRTHALVEGQPVRLVETLAADIARACLEDAVVDAAEVTVHKPEAPVGVPVDDIAVTIRRTRR